MSRILAFLVAALFALPLAAPATAQEQDPILVPDISQHEIVLRQGFTGANLILYGAVLDPADSATQYDIVVVLKGPTEPILLREKERIFGIWVNSQSTAYRSVPSFYAVASSRPILEIVDERTAAIYELGLDYLQLSPTGSIDPGEQQRFSEGLVDLRQRQGLYAQYDQGVEISEGVLYRADIPIPSNVVAGRYVAETFAIIDGRVITSATSEVQVFKEGFELGVEDAANENGFLYGMFAVGLSVFMGWAAGRLFALI
ncbi:TIGR02186 family protein [Aurantiacibacter poecillastricola]|uniref:TIGR02186 family protein n=1 Tax=Aurantiacibacter poecillastricola TaxID=3064385 RepID=UPI00273D1FAA|nr:TIGR02186 family protein [Aurantiacibacter sp. 219JJ12-13]MDP5262787.1 TIGR02186 family protein [Aurantiacibacter sp. 219JJ12-13]